MQYLQVFINSFCENSIEFLYSRRLKYLLESKRLVVDIQMIDVNSEIKKVMGPSVCNGGNIREQLFNRFRLVRNSDDEVTLP